MCALTSAALLSSAQTPAYHRDGPDDPPEPIEEETVGCAHTDARPIELADIFLKPEFWRAATADIPHLLCNSFGQGMLKNEFVYYPSKKHPATFLGQAVHESVIRLEEGSLRNLYVVLDYTEHHNEEEKMSRSFSEAERAISEKLQTEGTRQGHTFRNKRVIRIIEWRTPAARAQLRGDTRAPGAFVSVLLENPRAPDPGMEQRLSVNKEFFQSAASCAVSGKAGHKVLAIPMRKQLAGIGSCWSTTIARQLAYLGSEIEPQIVEAMVAGGEDKMLEEEEGKLGFRRLTYTIQTRDQASESSLHLLRSYNESAARHDAGKVKFSEKDDKIIFADNFIDMKTELLPSVPHGHQERYKLFRHIVMSGIDQNLPVGWTVIRWAPLNCRGGGKHRRMIIGYDLEKDLVHFSDSWGFPCEDRCMSFRAAFAMTVWMQVVVPHWMPSSAFPHANK